MFHKTSLVFLVVYCLSYFSHAQTGKKFFRKDYTYIEEVEGFYKIHTTPKTWAGAKRTCDVEGASLFFPENDDEAHAVISFWNRTQPKIGWAFVGLSDIMAEGVFETTDGKSISEVYNNWEPGQPNNYGGKQHCVYMYREGYLDDYTCDIQYSFICKKSLLSLEWNYRCDMPNIDYTFNKDFNKCYKLHTTPLKWNEAYAMCRAEQSHLAVITNRLEADYLAKFTESTPKPRLKGNYQRGLYHVGFHNKFDRGWQTVRGTPMHVNADVWWENYQPAGDGGEGCGSMFFNGYLINIDCNMRSFFICEHELDSSFSSEEFVNVTRLISTTSS